MSFSRTLMKGIERFKKAAAVAKDGQLDSYDAFELWDSFGFPIDLTEVCGLPLSPCCLCAALLQASVPHPVVDNSHISWTLADI